MAAVGDLHGINPQAAVAAVRARADRVRSGDRTPDGRKLGLVIEGGGMRGVCSAGGVVAMEHLGFTALFDEVYGTSAGAMNAGYFLAGQASMGIRIYFENMVRREIVNPLRLWKMFDIDRLFDGAVTVDKALRLDAILASPSKLFISLLDIDTGSRQLVEARTLGPLLLAALKAATALPVFYNRAIGVDGRRCIDAGIANTFPIEEALEAGCTDVVVLLTRPLGYRRAPAGRLSRWIFDRACARGNQTLSLVHARYHQRDAQLRDLALGRAASPGGLGANIATLCTDDAEVVERLTTDSAVLHAAALSYGRKVLRAFGGDVDSWTLASPRLSGRGAGANDQ
jgi:predicted patatin/cPLA2 family phospholipase